MLIWPWPHSTIWAPSFLLLRIWERGIACTKLKNTTMGYDWFEFDYKFSKSFDPASLAFRPGVLPCASPKGRVLRRFGVTTGIDFAQFGMELRQLRDCMKVWTFLFQTNKKERQICEFVMDFKKSFFCCSNLSNYYDIISLQPGL